MTLAINSLHASHAAAIHTVHFDTAEFERLVDMRKVGHVTGNAVGRFQPLQLKRSLGCSGPINIACVSISQWNRCICNAFESVIGS